MHPKQILAITSLFASTALAAPAAEVKADISAREPEAVEPFQKRGAADIVMYSGGGDRGCTGTADGYQVRAGQTYCIPVPSPKRCIYAQYSGCTIITWSGTNCQGSSYQLPSSGSFNVLYGSVTVSCS